ncbi:MAG: Gp49 family protein [Methylovirgula sp.]
MTGLEERDSAAGAVAVKPRVTLDQIKSLIASERFFVDDTLTICVLTLTNGYKVTGESAAADPANFNEELGRKISKDKATAEIWPLAGFLLRDKLHREDHPPVMRCKVVLHDRSQAYVQAPFDNDGKPRGRHTAELYKSNDGSERLWHSIDPSDPTNIVLDGERLRFGAVCPPSCDPNGAPENAIFGEFTPFFSLETQVRNQAVLARLKQGAAYYVDFIPAD